MKWQVKHQSSQSVVECADGWILNRPMQVRVDGKPFVASWNARLSILSIVDETNGSSKNLQVRNIVKQSYAGESESTLILDVWNKERACVETIKLQIELFIPGDARKKANAGTGGLRIRAPMTGKILQVLVSDGQSVGAGDVIVIIEAMKMENKIVAPRAGSIAKISVKPGQNISVGQDILLLL